MCFVEVLICVGINGVAGWICRMPVTPCRSCGYVDEDSYANGNCSTITPEQTFTRFSEEEAEAAAKTPKPAAATAPGVTSPVPAVAAAVGEKKENGAAAAVPVGGGGGAGLKKESRPKKSKVGWSVVSWCVSWLLPIHTPIPPSTHNYRHQLNHNRHTNRRSPAAPPHRGGSSTGTCSSSALQAQAC